MFDHLVPRIDACGTSNPIVSWSIYFASHATRPTILDSSSECCEGRDGVEHHTRLQEQLNPGRIFQSRWSMDLSQRNIRRNFWQLTDASALCYVHILDNQVPFLRCLIISMSNICRKQTNICIRVCSSVAAPDNCQGVPYQLSCNPRGDEYFSGAARDAPPYSGSYCWSKPHWQTWPRRVQWKSRIDCSAQFRFIICPSCSVRSLTIIPSYIHYLICAAYTLNTWESSARLL